MISGPKLPRTTPEPILANEGVTPSGSENNRNTRRKEKLMKHVMRTTLLATALALAATATPGMAAEEEGNYATQVVGKFGRGFANSTFGWAELFKNMVNEPHQKGWMYAPVGFVKGVGHAVGRTVVGVAELVTFPIPTTSPIHTELFWESMSTETTYGFK
jgi:putative exosortase-associated protein (TIGR04073 family)